MAKFAFITGYVSVVCKIVSFLIAFWAGYLFYDYETKYNNYNNQHGTIWKCMMMSCVMFISTLVCDILLTLILIRHKLDLSKIPLNTQDDEGKQNLSMFTLPLATHFENRLLVKQSTKKLSLRYLCILTLWLMISVLFIVGHWVNFVYAMYKEDHVIDDFLSTYIVVTVIFILFIFLPLGIFLMVGLH